MADEHAPDGVRLPGPEDPRRAPAVTGVGEYGAIDLRLPGPPPWETPEALLAAFGAALSHVAWPVLTFSLLLASGFYAHLYGPDVIALAQDKVPGADPAQRQLAQTRLGLWAVCLALPLQLATVLVLFARLAGIAPVDLGVTGRRPGRNLLLGAVGALALTPVCYGVLQLAVSAYAWWGVGGVHDHPYGQLAQHPLWPVEWALLLLAAVVVAPVWEELLFRGVLQNWFAARPWGGHAALALALALTASATGDKVFAARAEGTSAVLREAVPVLALLALVPVYLAVWARSATPAGPALFGTAVLFAWVHARAWPQPVALLPLGLGLGWLARRTGSLVGPVVLHALFNAAACALLLAQAFGR